MNSRPKPEDPVSAETTVRERKKQFRKQFSKSLYKGEKFMDQEHPKHCMLIELGEGCIRGMQTEFQRAPPAFQNSQFETMTLENGQLPSRRV